MSTRRAAALLALLTGLSVLVPAGPTAAREDPTSPVISPGHVLFNDPLGPEERQYALIRHIDARIDHARPGATVRLAAYSFAMPSTAQALLRAYRRGVGVGAAAAQRARHGHPQAVLRPPVRPVLPRDRRRAAREVRDDLQHPARPAPGDGRLDELHRARRPRAVAGPLL